MDEKIYVVCYYYFVSVSKWRGLNMSISYNGLWKLLIDKKLQRKDLIEQLNISSSTLAKMGKGEPVSLVVLERICEYLECDIGDVMNFYRSDINQEEQ